MNFKIQSYKDLGIRTDNLIPALIPYSVLTLICFFGLIIFLRSDVQLLQLWHNLYPSIAVLIILSVAQELFFRGYLMHGLKSTFRNPITIIVINSLLFAAMHLVFPERAVLVPEAFLSGIGFATVYYYNPNVILASISHALLNWAIIPICYFALVRCIG